MKKVLKIVVGVVVGLFILMLIIGACSDPAVVEPEPEKEEVAAKPAPKKEEAPKKDLEEKSVEEAVGEPTKDEKQMLANFKENFQDSEVTFNKEAKVYQIELKGDQMIMEIGQMVNGTRSKDSWYSLVDSTVTVSNNMSGFLGEGYSVALTNPANKENIILLVRDGIVLYDIFAQ